MQKYEVNASWMHKILYYVQFWGEIRYLMVNKAIFGRKSPAFSCCPISNLQNMRYSFGCGLQSFYAIIKADGCGNKNNS